VRAAGRILAAAFLALGRGAAAQSTAAPPPAPLPYEAKEFAPWMLDARRFETVAIGSFPLTIFYSTFAYDVFRWSTGKNAKGEAIGDQFSPTLLFWPLKLPNSVPTTKDERQGIIIAAASASVAVAVIDLVIMKIKEREERKRTLLASAIPAPSAKADEGSTPIEAKRDAEEAASGDAAAVTGSSGGKAVPLDAGNDGAATAPAE
jgi:hypothetical protein